MASMIYLFTFLLALFPAMASSEPHSELGASWPVESTAALDLPLDETAYQRFVEAEAFAPRSAAWSPVETEEARLRGVVGTPWPWWKKDKDKPQAPSDLRYLDGSNTESGVATNSVVLPHGGIYYLFFRYRASPGTRTGNAAFQLVIRQADGVAASVTLNPNGTVTATGNQVDVIRNLGDGSGSWPWGRFQFHAAKGVAVLELHKISEQGKVVAAPFIDCLLLTDDKSYQPDVIGQHPLYVRFDLHKDHPEPSTLVISGITIDQKGIHRPEKWWNEPLRPFNPGESSGWLNMAPFLDYGTTLGSGVNARGKNGLCENANFTVHFSTTPSDEGRLNTFERRGQGSGGIVLINLARQAILTEIDASRKNLERALDTPDAPGKRARRFHLSSTLNLSPTASSPAAISNELAVFDILGLSDVGNPALTQSPLAQTFDFASPPYYGTGETLWDVHQGCLCSPDESKFTNVFQRLATQYAKPLMSGAPLVNGCIDEPMFGISALLTCGSRTTKCPERYRDFLRANHVQPEDLGLKTLDDAVLTRDSSEGARFYWTARYRDHVVTTFFKSITQTATATNPQILNTANIGTEIVYNGNMVQYGMNWFELFRTGAFTYGRTEDWSNCQRTYQHAAYMMDVMRAACRDRNVPFEMLNVLCGRSAWEIEAKGFSEIGHGATGIGFFRYGPRYTGSSDSENENPAIYAPIKRLCRATGAAEEHLLDGRVADGDAALLLSTTADTWEVLSFDNVFGKERMLMSLLLLHCGIRTDILGEDDLAGRLEKYRLLFVSDVHLRRACLPALVDWVRGGGTLYLGPNALSRDEYDRPLGLDAMLDITRGTFTLHQRPGNLDTARKHFKALGTAGLADHPVTIFCGEQLLEGGETLEHDLDQNSPALVRFPAGKGQVMLSRLFAGLGYIGQATPVAGGFYSQLDYPEGPRAWMRRVLERSGVAPRLATDHPLVEAMLKEAPKADLITLANWSGETRRVTVVLRDPATYREITTVTGQNLTVTRQPGKLALAVTIGAGDYLICTLDSQRQALPGIGNRQ